ncbi:hypothetical protein DID88_006544 [Monilinia fructigena]|uniref:Uncharacterized protein n=1 Tax=Monilinia fructigena TaxID=38457 RepID=A0A395IH57_9HELO|nr:hypothetical protein DID88_006544 [Monilinia fructigena]
MCVTHIYTDCYPKRTVEFHQTILCPNAENGILCPAHVTNKHPPRILASNDDRSSKDYIDQGLKVPATSKSSPHKSTTTSTYRYSQGDKKDKSPGREPRLRLVRKKSGLALTPTPRRKHPKEHIVIVDAPDSPQGSESLQQYAPDSPAIEEFHSKTLLMADRPHRQESPSPRRSPNRGLNPAHTVVLEQQHWDKREHSKERDRTLHNLPIILAPEPPSRSPSRERELVDMRIRREEEEREENVKEKREREEMRKAAEELERERIRREKSEDEKRREAEYKKFWEEREREAEKESENEKRRPRKKGRDEEEKKNTEGQNDHEQKQREENHRHEREREREIEEKERGERMRNAEKSERKAADDAKRLAEQVKAFAKEDEEIRRRPAIPETDREDRWKRDDEDMYARLRDRQVRDEGLVGLGRGASFSGRGEGDKERERNGEKGVLDRLKERQKGPEEGYLPKRRTTLSGSGGERRRRGEERIVWGEGEGGRGGRW